MNRNMKRGKGYKKSPIPIPSIDRGYLRVSDPGHPTANKDGYCRQHRWVAWNAGKLKSLDMIVHHKNGDKSDNRPSNLEALTKSQHVIIHKKGKPGRDMRGEKNSRVILTEADVHLIRWLKKEFKSFFTAKEVGEIFGVVRGTIYDIWKKKSWKHI